EGRHGGEILKDAPDKGAAAGMTQEEMTALLPEPLVDLEKNARARAVELVHPLEIEDSVACARLGRRFHAAGQSLGGAEEDRALELEHDDLRAALREQIHEPRMARSARPHGAAVNGPAHH